MTTVKAVQTLALDGDDFGIVGQLPAGYGVDHRADAIRIVLRGDVREVLPHVLNALAAGIVTAGLVVQVEGAGHTAADVALRLAQAMDAQARQQRRSPDVERDAWGCTAADVARLLEAKRQAAAALSVAS